MATRGEEDVTVRFGAVIDEFQSKIGQVSGSLSTLMSRFQGLAAVLAGGTAFKHFIDEASSINREAEKMSRQLGISTETASTMMTALDDIGSSADVYTGAFTKFNRMLRNNSEEMRQMGVDTVSLKNGTKDSNQVFMESIKLLSQYAPGVDQGQASMKLFGTRVGDVTKLLRLNDEAIAEAAKKNRELNLVVTAESFAATEKYRMALNDVNDVMKGVSKTIGETMMPAFAEASKMLADAGPALVGGAQAAAEAFVGMWQEVKVVIETVWGFISEVFAALSEAIGVVFNEKPMTALEFFKTVFRTVHALLIGFRVSVELMVSAVKTQMDVLSSAFSSFLAVAERALHLDWEGTKAEWQRGIDERVRIVKEGGEKLVAIAAKGNADIASAVMSSEERERIKAENAWGSRPGTTTETGKKKIPIVDSTAAAIATAQLALEKADRDARIALLKEYDAEEQRIQDDAYARKLISIEDYFRDKERLQQEENAREISARKAEIAGIRTRMGAEGVKEPQRLQFMAQIAALEGQIAIAEAKTLGIAQQINIEKENALRAEADGYAMRKANAAFDLGAKIVEADRASAQQRLALGQITANEMFAIEDDLEGRLWDLRMAELNSEFVLARGNAEKLDEIEKKRAVSFAEHQAKLTDIANRAQLAQLAMAEGYARREADAALDLGSRKLDAERAAAQQRLAMGKITADEMFGIERDLEERLWELRMANFRSQMLLARGNQEKLDEIDKARTSAFAEHQAKLTDISNRAVLERTKFEREARMSIEGGFTSMISSLLSGVVTLQDAIRQFAVTIAKTFEDLIAKKFTERLFSGDTALGKMVDRSINVVTNMVDTIVAKFIGGEAAQTAVKAAGMAQRATLDQVGVAEMIATQGIAVGAQVAAAEAGVAITTTAQTAQTAAVATGTAERAGIEKAGSAASLLTMTGDAIKRIGIAIAAAFAELVEFFGFLGPFAPVAALGVSAGALGMAMSMLNSAEGGWWQIPHNQIAAVHKNEMVLPAAEAHALRTMLGGGGGGAGGTVHIHTAGGDFIHKNDLAKMLKQMNRDFVFVKG
jgi:hypothetical protein